MDPHEGLAERPNCFANMKACKGACNQRPNPANAQENQKLLEKQMLSEGKDLEKLDGISLLNLWHSIRSSKDLAGKKKCRSTWQLK